MIKIIIGTVVILVSVMQLSAAQKYKSGSHTWYAPSKEICVKNGGSFNHGICRADWFASINICYDSNPNRFPPRTDVFISALESMGCEFSKGSSGGSAVISNMRNKNYRAKRKESIFLALNYWSNDKDIINSDMCYSTTPPSHRLKTKNAVICTDEY